jgi:D-alanyl-D-alanine carboxypeptidase
MFRSVYGVARGLRLSMFGAVAVVTVLAIATEPADARRHRRSGGHASHSTSRDNYSPPYSAIVVDANSGKTLHEASADSLRHPASLTKIMTLYLLFERLESGKMKLNSAMPVSDHASVQAPTKLGLRPGQNLEVEDAIRGLVTKSANDAAVVVAEAIAGNEDDFAALMTSKARALGMTRTTYRNASGLPNDEQVTTARDQALLGRAIQERFPRYYRYFSTPSFTYRGESMRNHNRLLGRVEGVDGIKTGYTRASGFNLVTSVKRDNRHIVAVVLGGSSAGSRDARMRDLIASYVADASNRRTATQVAEAAAPVEPRVPARPAQVAAAGGAYALASASSMPTPAAAAPVQSGFMVASKPQVAAGSSEPLKPIAVKTIKVKLAGVEAAALAPSAPMIAVPEETGSTALAPKAAATQPAPSAPPTPAVQPWPTPNKEPLKAAAWPSPAAAPAPEPAPAAKTQVVAKTEPAVKTAKAEPAPARKAQTHSGWIIQIGAFETASEAKQRLDAAQSKAKSVLARADAFTEPVTKGDKTFYRARFAGLEKSQAEATCKQLKRNDISCMTLKN